jgi:hypothetical protein
MQSGDKMTRSTDSSTDNLTNAEECPICHKVGFHKISCPTQKATVFLSDVKVEGVSGKQTCGFCVEQATELPNEKHSESLDTKGIEHSELHTEKQEDKQTCFCFELEEVEMIECPICHKVGFHKLSCTNNAKVAIPMAVIPKIEEDDSIE